MFKTTKTILWIVIAIIVIGGIWYGVSKKPIAEKESIKIGYIAVQTGPAGASWGMHAVNAINLAIEEINTQSKKINLILGDSQANPAQGISEFRKLNTVDKPDIFIVDGSSVVYAIAPIAKETDKPIIFNVVALSGITKENQNLFRNFYSCDISGPLLASKAYQIGFKKIGVLSASEPYSESCLKFFGDKLKELGGEIEISEKYIMASDKDFRTQLHKIKSQNPDAIYIIGPVEAQLLEIVKEIKELDITKTILAETVIYAPMIREKILELTNPPEIYFTATPFYLGSPRAEEFKQKYKNKYGVEPPYLSGYSYDTIYLIQKAIEISNKEKIDLTQTLLKATLEGVSGYLKFDPSTRETKTEMRFVKLNKDGTLQIID